jgi:carbon storage regulator
MNGNGNGNGMLILTRRVGEAIVIGPDVSVMVLGIKGGQVRIGVSAPRNVPVHRQEIAEKIRAQHGTLQVGQRQPVAN